MIGIIRFKIRFQTVGLNVIRIIRLEFDWLETTDLDVSWTLARRYQGGLRLTDTIRHPIVKRMKIHHYCGQRQALILVHNTVQLLAADKNLLIIAIKISHSCVSDVSFIYTLLLLYTEAIAIFIYSCPTLQTVQ